ncbi:unnamed protein product, partial [Closterium sp. NIES-54]
FLPPLLPSPAPPCLPCVEGRQRTAPHSSFPPTTSPLQTLHMDAWGSVRVSGQDCERYFLLVVDNYTQYTTVFPLRSKVQRFRKDLPVLRLHSDRGGELSSDLLRDFCRREGILQSFTLPASPQQNWIVERCIGLFMEVSRSSIIHAAASNFQWPFAGPSPSGVSQVDPLPETVHVKVAVDSCAAKGAASGGAASGGAEPGGADPGNAKPGGAEPEGAEPGGAESEGAESGGAEPRGIASA